MTSEGSALKKICGKVILRSSKYDILTSEVIGRFVSGLSEINEILSVNQIVGVFNIIYKN